MKKDGGIQIVLDVDGDGKFASTAVRRAHQLDDDDGSIINTKTQAVTFAQLGDEFPLAEFVDKAAKAALLKAEATDTLTAELAAALAELAAKDVAHAEALKEKDALFAQAQATIVDRDTFISGLHTSIVEWINARVTPKPQ